MPRARLTPKWLTADQMRALLRIAKANSKRDYAIMLFAYRHGLRASEIGLLTKNDLDLKAQRIRVRRLKGSLPAEHPLDPREAQAIRSYLRSRSDSLPHLFLSRNGRPISRAMLNVLMKSYGAEAKLPVDRRHFHTLKHSIAVHLLSAGEDVGFVRDWLGHKEIQNTLVYAQLISPKRDERALRVFSSPEIA